MKKDLRRYFVRRQFAVKSAFFRDHVTQDEVFKYLRLYHGLDYADMRSQVRSCVDAMRLAGPS